MFTSVLCVVVPTAAYDGTAEGAVKGCAGEAVPREGGPAGEKARRRDGQGHSSEEEGVFARMEWVLLLAVWVGGWNEIGVVLLAWCVLGTLCPSLPHCTPAAGGPAATTGAAHPPIDGANNCTG